MSARASGFGLLTMLGQSLLADLGGKETTSDNMNSHELPTADVLEFAPRGYPLKLCVMKPPSGDGE